MAHEARRDSIIRRFGIIWMNEQLEDHPPRSDRSHRRMLIGKPAKSIEADGREHGHQRRLAGYAMRDLLRE